MHGFMDNFIVSYPKDETGKIGHHLPCSAIENHRSVTPLMPWWHVRYTHACPPAASSVIKFASAVAQLLANTL